MDLFKSDNDLCFKSFNVYNLFFALFFLPAKINAASTCEVFLEASGCRAFVDYSYYETFDQAMSACVSFSESRGYVAGTCRTAEGLVAAGNLYVDKDSRTLPLTLGIFYYNNKEYDYGDSCKNTENPINIATGNKFYEVVDYVDSNFSLKRLYNSFSGSWSFGIQSLLLESHQPSQDVENNENGMSYLPHKIILKRDDAKWVDFTYDGSGYITTNRGYKLELINQQYIVNLTKNKNFYSYDVDGTFIAQDGQPSYPDLGYTHRVTHPKGIDYYDVQGRLAATTNRENKTFTLIYNDNEIIFSRAASEYRFIINDEGAIATVYLPDGSQINYEYQYGRHLRKPYSRISEVSKHYPNQPAIILWKYSYGNQYPSSISTVTDANGAIVSSVSYVGNGLASRSEKGPPGSGIEAVTLEYHPDGTRTLTNALGKQSTYHFVQFNGEYKISKVEGHPSDNCAGANKNYTYNDNGFIASKTDWNGNVTTYTHNTNGQEISRTEAAGTPQVKTFLTQWHAEFNRPIKITEPERITEYTYDTQGRLLNSNVTSTP